MVTSSVRTDAPSAPVSTRKTFSLGYLGTSQARARLASLGGHLHDVPPAPNGPDGVCHRPLLMWDSVTHTPWLLRCGSGKSKVCPSCAATRKRRVRRVAHLGVLDRLASGGFLGLLTVTAPGDPGHRRWSVTGPSSSRPLCSCCDSAPFGIGHWNRAAARRWNHLRTLLRREYSGAQFFRAVEPQTRGALHLHVIVWSPVPLDVVVLQDLALRAGFGCNTRLDVCRGPEDGARFANYVTKYVTKAIDDRSALPWDDLDAATGELRASAPTYRPWSQSAGFGVRMRTHLEAIADQRRRAAVRLRENEAGALDLVTELPGATLVGDSVTAAQPPP